MQPRKISVAELRIADIIVSTTNHPTSRGIRTAIGADVSHAMVYIGNGRVVEATGEGVKNNPLNIAFTDATLAIALRRINMSDAAKKAVVENALKFENRLYDHIGAAGSGMTGKRVGATLRTGCIINPVFCLSGVELSRRAANNASDAVKDTMFFCSELVARVFELAKVPIVNGHPSFTNPRAIRVSTTLRYVGHLIGLET